MKIKDYKLVYEEYACWGCKACEVACKQTYNPPAGTYDPKAPDSLRYVSVRPDGPKYVDDKLYFMFRIDVCRHCIDPACTRACPEGAIRKDGDTGIVILDRDTCNGCNAIRGESGRAKEEASPCGSNCPAGNDVQGYVALAGKGKYRQALELIKETSPFPSICGRVCHHPCESECNRKQVDQALAIRSIERFLADWDHTSGSPYVPLTRGAKEEKVAVIGSGPAGLTAAYFLARDGYNVTVIEALPVIGGMMRAGIPEYRLPRDIIARDIKVIEEMGVEFRTSVTLGKDVTLRSLREDGFKAIFLATGLHDERELGVENENLEGVISGLAFLRDVALGNGVSVGQRVVVIGGGNVAIDVALTSLRKGATDVTMICLEDRDQMPAWPDEIKEALEEGVKIVNCRGPHRFLEEKGVLTGLQVKKCTCVFDECGTFNPQYDETDLSTIEADTAILAIGQAPDLSLAKVESIPVTETGRFKADGLTLQTPITGLFVGGDAFHGPKSVVEAIASGREAAVSIDRYLKGLSLTVDRDRRVKVVTKPVLNGYDPAPRHETPLLRLDERTKGFAEVRQGFSEETAHGEGRRCLSCGASCIQACPYDAITFNVAEGKAQKCNLCYERVTHGLYPSCADNVCLAHCIYFGDPARIAQTIEEKRKIRGGWGEIIPKHIVFDKKLPIK